MAMSKEGISATPAQPLTLKAATEDKFRSTIIDSSSLLGSKFLFHQSPILAAFSHAMEGLGTTLTHKGPTCQVSSKNHVLPFNDKTYSISRHPTFRHRYLHVVRPSEVLMLGDCPGKA